MYFFRFLFQFTEHEIVNRVSQIIHSKRTQEVTVDDILVMKIHSNKFQSMR